jgi:hypothetical protein
MEAIKFTSIQSDELVITGSKLEVTTKFGDRYTGWLNEKDSVCTHSRLGLGYLMRTYREYKSNNNNN